MWLTARRRWAILLLGLAAAGVAGCGGDDPPAASGNDTTPSTGEASTTTAEEGDGGPGGECPVEEGEVSAAIGTAATAREGGLVVAGGVTCEFNFENNGLVAVRTYTSAAQAGHEASLNVASDDVAVDGVGDTAAWSQSLGTVFVITGETGLQVQIVQPGGTPEQDAAVEIAQAALGRL